MLDFGRVQGIIRILFIFITNNNVTFKSDILHERSYLYDILITFVLSLEKVM